MIATVNVILQQIHILFFGLKYAAVVYKVKLWKLRNCPYTYISNFMVLSFFMEGVYSAEKNYMGKGIAVIKVMYITPTISTY